MSDKFVIDLIDLTRPTEEITTDRQAFAFLRKDKPEDVGRILTSAYKAARRTGYTPHEAVLDALEVGDEAQERAAVTVIGAGGAMFQHYAKIKAEVWGTWTAVRSAMFVRTTAYDLETRLQGLSKEQAAQKIGECVLYLADLATRLGIGFDQIMLEAVGEVNDGAE